MTIEHNPLLDFSPLPAFSKIKAEHVVPAVEHVVAECRKTIEQTLASNTSPTWDNLIAVIEDADDKIDSVWAPISHINSVMNTDEFRKAHDQCLSILTEHGTWVGQNKDLYNVYKTIKQSADFNSLSQAKKKTIENALRDFKLAGIALPTEQQKRFGEISKRLAELESKFANNVLDATMAWSKLITDKNELAGMPQSFLDVVQQEAKDKGLEGYLLTLNIHSYLPILDYCDNAEIRQEIQHAFITRASELGPNAGEFENTDFIKEILELRHERALMLGFKNYSENSLAAKMAESPAQVLNFLNDLAQKAKPQGIKDMENLRKFAKDDCNNSEIKTWDVYYYKEKLKRKLFNFSDEDLRPYFPEDKVVNGLFEVLNRLFNVTVKERFDIDTWHKDVRFFEIFDENNQLQGSFYLDLYAREHKRGGAWMAECKTHRINSFGKLQKPVTFLTCNFTKPVGDKQALFSHDEVVTLFHETGHGIHHMLTKVETSAASGLTGVPWDAVELPSQFLENWCWQEEALAFISGHHETDEPLPKEMLDKMLEAKNFMSSIFVLRQLKLGLFDFMLHTNYEPTLGAQLRETLTKVENITSVVPLVDYDRFYNGFTHIFASGYSAGYYSYLWAEVLSADSFSRFEEEGIFNQQTGKEFKQCILEMGGSDELIELFRRFRGREPKIDALLRHKGINA